MPIETHRRHVMEGHLAWQNSARLYRRRDSANGYLLLKYSADEQRDERRGVRRLLGCTHLADATKGYNYLPVRASITGPRRSPLMDDSRRFYYRQWDWTTNQ